jgi:hypothetical protein
MHGKGTLERVPTMKTPIQTAYKFGMTSVLLHSMVGPAVLINVPLRFARPPPYRLRICLTHVCLRSTGSCAHECLQHWSACSPPFK